MPGPEIEARIRRVLESPNVSPEKKRALEEQLRAYQAKAQSVASPAPAAPPAEALSPGGGGPGGMSGGGGAMAPGADPYREVEREIVDAAKTSGTHTPTPEPDWTETVPDMGRAALAGLDRSITGGLLTRAADFVDPGTKERLDSARERYPYLGLGGSVLGALLPAGLAGQLGKAGAGMAGMKAGQGLLQSMGRGALAGAGAGAAQSGIEAAVDGQSLEGVQDAAQTGFNWGALLGPLGGALSWGGQKMANRLRNPGTPQGRDLQLAEKGGAQTSVIQGVKQGSMVAELAEEGTRAGGVSPESVAAERAAPVLGKAVQGKMDETLGAVRAQNEAQYQTGAETTLRPLLRKQLGILRDATHEGQLLPGQDVAEVVRNVKATGSPKLVSRTSAEAHMAEADEMMDVGLARHLGILPKGAGAADADNVVVFEPRNVDARGIDSMTRAYDQRANAGADVYDPAKVPAKKMGAAAREARAGLGPEWEAAKASQSSSLEGMKNTVEAAGLPRSAESVDLGNFGTLDALYQAVRRYRNEGNLIADRELDRLAAANPELRSMLDAFAGTAATQRLRGQADVSFTPSGNISPYGFKGAAALRADPLMRWFGSQAMTPVGGLAGAATEQQRGRR
jgi:hypothetical protein